MPGGQHASPVKPGPPHWAYFTFAHDAVGEGVATGTGAKVGADVGANVGAGVGIMRVVVVAGAGTTVSLMPPVPAQLASHVSAHGSH